MDVHFRRSCIPTSISFVFLFLSKRTPWVIFCSTFVNSYLQPPFRPQIPSHHCCRGRILQNVLGVLGSVLGRDWALRAPIVPCVGVAVRQAVPPAGLLLVWLHHPVSTCPLARYVLAVSSITQSLPILLLGMP